MCRHPLPSAVRPAVGPPAQDARCEPLDGVPRSIALSGDGAHAYIVTHRAYWDLFVCFALGYRTCPVDHDIHSLTLASMHGRRARHRCCAGRAGPSFARSHRPSAPSACRRLPPAVRPLPRSGGDTLGAVTTIAEGPSKGVLYLGSPFADRLGVLWLRFPDATWLGRTLLASALDNRKTFRLLGRPDGTAEVIA